MLEWWRLIACVRESCTAQASVKRLERGSSVFLNIEIVQTEMSSHQGLKGFKRQSSKKIKVWCSESTFCYFYPLGITSQRWMTAQNQLGKARMSWLYLLQKGPAGSC